MDYRILISCLMAYTMTALCVHIDPEKYGTHKAICAQLLILPSVWYFVIITLWKTL